MTAPALPAFTIFGHRGAAGAPENTVAAFEAALAAGLRWLELDVQAHHEALIVFHDDDLQRCADVDGRVLDTPLAQLQALDLGDDQHIPLLDDLLTQLRGRAALNIELKAGRDVGARTAAALRGALSAGWQSEDLLVSSFDHAELAAFHRALPEAPVAPLFDSDASTAEAVAAALDSHIVHLDMPLADTETLTRLHTAGLRVHVFTVNDPAQAERLRAAGAGGVFTDHPERYRLEGDLSQDCHGQPLQ